MQTTISTTGRVISDLELQTSQNGKNTAYVQFSLAVTKGFGNHTHTNFFQCIIFGEPAVEMAAAGVKKRSLISVSGDLDLVEYTRKSDGVKCISPKITLHDWRFILTNRPKNDVLTPMDDEDFIQVNCDGDESPFT